MSSPITKTRSSRAISCAIASVMASIIVIFRAMFSRSPLFLRPDVIRQLRSIRIRALLGEFNRLVDFLRDVLCDLVLGLVGEIFPVAENFFEEHERVALLPRLDFFLGAILRGIDFGVAVPAIGLALEERGAVAGARAFDGFRGRVVNSEDVVAVQADAGEAISLGAIGKINQRGLQAQGHGFGPQIVLADIDDGQAVNAGEVQGFMETAQAGGAISKERDNDGIFALLFESEGDAGSNGKLAGNAAGGSDGVYWRIAHVSGSGFAAVGAGGLAEKLCEAEF